MNSAFRDHYRSLLLLYQRPADMPILLRFSNSFFSSSLEPWCESIEKAFGPALALWSERIDCKEDVDDVMFSLSKIGSIRGSDATHFIYGFFANYPTDVDTVKLVFDMVFNGEVDFWFSGKVGEPYTMVRRVFEKSPEYMARLSHVESTPT